MLKRDRTTEEKAIDQMMKSGIMRLGKVPASQQGGIPKPPFPHVLYWDVLGRKGQRCKIIKPGLKIALVEFEDGFRHTVNRMAIRKGD